MPQKRPTRLLDDEQEEEIEAPPQRKQQRQRPAEDSGGGDFLPDSEVNLKGGHGAARREMAASSTYANRFQVDSRKIVKFPEPEPFASYRRHWITRYNQGGKTLLPVPCYQSIKKPCPLCKGGHRPVVAVCYNVIEVDDKGDVELKSWECGVRVAKSLDDIAEDPKLGPLTRDYYLITKSGEGTSTSYNISRIKTADLVEDYGIPEPDQTEMKSLELYDSSIIKFWSQEKMEELAEEIADEYG